MHFLQRATASHSLRCRQLTEGYRERGKSCSHIMALSLMDGGAVAGIALP